METGRARSARLRPPRNLAPGSEERPGVVDFHLQRPNGRHVSNLRPRDLPPPRGDGIDLGRGRQVVAGGFQRPPRFGNLPTSGQGDAALRNPTRAGPLAPAEGRRPPLRPRGPPQGSPRRCARLSGATRRRSRGLPRRTRRDREPKLGEGVGRLRPLDPESAERRRPPIRTPGGPRLHGALPRFLQGARTRDQTVGHARRSGTRRADGLRVRARAESRQGLLVRTGLARIGVLPLPVGPGRRLPLESRPDEGLVRGDRDALRRKPASGRQDRARASRAGLRAAEEIGSRRGLARL